MNIFMWLLFVVGGLSVVMGVISGVDGYIYGDTSIVTIVSVVGFGGIGFMMLMAGKAMGQVKGVL